MKVDAHYYAVLAFARASGFKKESAQQLAYASQFVDDAIINHIVISGNRRGVQHDTIEGKPSFFGMATCHAYTRVKTFNYYAMINNTCAFHFVPDCKGPNFPKRLQCKEESPVIKAILKDALKSDDVVRFGMVLHPYADTFSHQGFSGLLSKVNDIKECEPRSKLPGNLSNKVTNFFKWFAKDKFDKVFDFAMPAYGHGQAMEYPDLPYLSWEYRYDSTDKFSGENEGASGLIDNKERFTKAFKGIRGYLQRYLKNHPQHRDANYTYKDFDTLYETLLQCKKTKKRIKIWQDTLVQQGLFAKGEPACEYEELQWVQEAFEGVKKKRFKERKVKDVRLKPTFPDSNWYRFYLGVKWYKKRFFQYCSQNNVDIPR